MPTWNVGDAVVLDHDHHADRGERREHRRPDQLEVVEGDLRQPVDPRREQAERPRRVGHREHQHGEQDEVGAHRSGSSVRGPAVGRARVAGRAVGLVVRARHRVALRGRRGPERRGLLAARAGTSSPTSGPTSPPAMIPMDGARAPARRRRAIAAPTSAATSSRRPVISPTASPIIAAGKMMSMPNRAGSGIWPPSDDPGQRREVPRDERRRRSPRSSSRARRSGRAAGSGRSSARTPRRSGGGPSPRGGDAGPRAATARAPAE